MNGAKADHDNMRKILPHFGNPQNKLNAVHITGTNGKGSTAAFISSILINARHRVGLFTSPHLCDFRERIQINGEKINKSKLCNILLKIKNVSEKLGISPSYFEVMTILAICYFAAEKCDICIFEVGIGGRLDPTNVISAKVCVITGIDYDHTEYLGDTKESIAREKVGIVKPGSVLVANIDDDRLYKFIEKNAYGLKAAETLRVGDVVKGRLISVRPEGITFSISSASVKLPRAVASLVGDYQIENAFTAVAAVESMKKLGMTRAWAESIKKGLAETCWPGRFEIFGRKRQLVMDGAHNAQGMANFTRNLKAIFPTKKIRAIVGIIKSKDYAAMLNSIAAVSGELMITGIDNPSKRVEIETLYDYAVKIHPDVKMFPNVVEALNYAKQTITPDDLVCITGSLYLVGEARGYVMPGARN